MKGKTLIDILSASASYSSAIGERGGIIKVFPSDRVPQGAERPYATYTIVSRIEGQDKDARGIYTVNMQVDHFATTADQAEDLEEHAISVLNRFKGLVNGQKIRSIRVFGGSDSFDQGQESSHRLTEFEVKIHP